MNQNQIKQTLINSKNPVEEIAEKIKIVESESFLSGITYSSVGWIVFIGIVWFLTQIK